MRIKSMMMALLGFAVAGGSVMAANAFVSRSQEQASERVEVNLAEVVVVARDIPFGQPIEAAMVTTQSWPRNALPAGAFTSLDAVIPALQGEPRRAKRALAQGEILLASKVSDFGEKVTVVDRMSPGARAVTIKVDAVTGVAGFITPGDRIDIVLTHGGGGDLKAVTILQNIRVLAVDQVADETQDTPGLAATVTVEVTPEQNQTLVVARQAGQLSLALRTADSEDGPLDMTRLGDVVREQAPADETSPPAMIRVRRAGQVSQTDVGK